MPFCDSKLSEHIYVKWLQLMSSTSRPRARSIDNPQVGIGPILLDEAKIHKSIQVFFFFGYTAISQVLSHILDPFYVDLLAALMMFLARLLEDPERTPVGEVVVPLLPLAVLSFVIGVTVGFLGAGNFLFVPLLIYVLKVPTRIAIGSSLFIAMLNTFSGFLGKLLTGQIPFLMALVVVLGTGVGATAGEWTHSRLSTPVLRYVYAGMVGAITVRIWITLLS